ncbi:hypothetical protein Tco_0095650 [Tanacetum coccineum]
MDRLIGGSADGSSTSGSADGSLSSGPKPTRDWALPWPVIDRFSQEAQVIMWPKPRGLVYPLYVITDNDGDERRQSALLRLALDDVLDSLKPKETLVIRQRYGFPR